MASIRKKGKGPYLVDLEKRYLNTKAWNSKFFYVRRDDWEFPTSEDMYKDFPIRAIWGVAPDEKSLWANMPLLSGWELARIKMVYAWYANHPDDLGIDFLLSSRIINKYLTTPDCLHIWGQDFMFADTIRSLFPSLPIVAFKMSTLLLA